MKTKFIRWFGMLALAASGQLAAAQGTAFTYQGRLLNNGSPANGTYNLTFSLYNAVTGGSLVGTTVSTNGVLVTNGLFTVQMDFGASPWTGLTNWLAIGVATNGVSSFITLTPLQQLTPVPNAIFAETAGSLEGTISTAQLPGGLLTNNERGVTLAGTFSGNLTGISSNLITAFVTNQVPLAQLPGAVVTNNQADVTLGSVTVGGSLNLPFPATIYSGTNILLSDSGSLYDGYEAGAADCARRPVILQLFSDWDNVGIGDYALQVDNGGSYNMAIGQSALNSNTTGVGNTAAGYDALLHNVTGGNNVAVGYEALMDNTTFGGLTAIGAFVLGKNTAGYQNTGVGYEALQNNQSGYANTASGFSALQANTSGFDNTAVGGDAMAQNSGGSENTAMGYTALNANQLGSYNVAIGAGALLNLNYNQIGYDPADSASYNTAVGVEALKMGTLAENEVAVGYQALFNGNFLKFSTAVGYQALWSAGSASAQPDGLGNDNNTAIGYQALFNTSSGEGNVAVGYQAGINNTSGDDNIYIGSPGGFSFEDGTIRIGYNQNSCYLAGTVYAISFNSTSDRNEKENFKPVDNQEVLAKVAALPISEWNFKIEKKGVQHIGPMAQDFQSAFELSADNKHISMVDEGGVALAAIQGLNQKLEQQSAAKDAEIQNLEEKLDALQAVVKQLVH